MTERMEGRGGETLRPAQELQEKLHKFAMGDLPDREACLPDLLGYIDANATSELFDELTDPLSNPSQERKDYRPGFRRAISNTLSIPFQVGDEEVNPWVGGYTVVALSGSGQVLAAESETKGRVYAVHGSNLFPYALSKAVIELHLNLMGRHEGLDNTNNFEYIAQLLPERKVYLGAAGAPNASTVVAASGCELKGEYIDTLLPEEMRFSEYPVDLFAGHADMRFAMETAARWFFEPRREAREEPVFFAQLRRSH